MTATTNPFALGGDYGRDIRYQMATKTIESASASLPTIGTVDGSIVRYKALATTSGAATDVVWTLQFNSSDGYWYPIGSGAMVAFVSGSFASSATATWQDSVTPKITVPFAGDYEVDYSALANQATATVWPARAGVIQNGGGGPAVYAESLVTLGSTNTLTGFEYAIGVTAATVISLGVYTNDGTPAHTTWTQRWVRVRPIRVR